MNWQTMAADSSFSPYFLFCAQINPKKFCNNFNDISSVFNKISLQKQLFSKILTSKRRCGILITINTPVIIGCAYSPGGKEREDLSRLDIKNPSRSQTVLENLYRDVERHIEASPPGLCPVDMSHAFLQMCHAQSCGKCVPCRIGLGQLSKLIEQELNKV